MIVTLYDDTNEILVSDVVHYFYEKEWINFDLAYNLLQETDIINMMNKMCVNVETETAYEKMSHLHNYTECIKKFIKEEDKKELLRNLRCTTNSIIVPLKAYLLIEIRWRFYHELDTLWYATSLNTDECDKISRDEYKKKLREQADNYTKIFSRCNREAHYYFSKPIYDKAKEEFWKLSDLEWEEQILERTKFISLSKFLNKAQRVSEWEKYLKLLWIDAKKDDVRVSKEDWEWAVTWLDFSLFSMLFMGILPIIHLHRNIEDAPIWLLYDLYCSWDTSFYKDVLPSWWSWIVLNPFHTFKDFCEGEWRERKEEIEKIKEKYKDVFYWDKTLDDIKKEQLIKDILRCLEIWANKLIIKAHNHTPTEMKHMFSLTKEQERDYEKYKEYALMEGDWVWHIWPTWWKWVKFASEWWKTYSYKGKKKNWK